MCDKAEMPNAITQSPISNAAPRARMAECDLHREDLEASVRQGGQLMQRRKSGIGAELPHHVECFL